MTILHALEERVKGTASNGNETHTFNSQRVSQGIQQTLSLGRHDNLLTHEINTSEKSER